MAARSRLGSAVDLAAIFLGYSLRAGVVKFYSSSGAAAALAAYLPSAVWTVGRCLIHLTSIFFYVNGTLCVCYNYKHKYDV